MLRFRATSEGDFIDRLIKSELATIWMGCGAFAFTMLFLIRVPGSSYLNFTPLPFSLCVVLLRRRYGKIVNRLLFWALALQIGVLVASAILHARPPLQSFLYSCVSAFGCWMVYVNLHQAPSDSELKW